MEVDRHIVWDNLTDSREDRSNFKWSKKASHILEANEMSA
jgi:hypothetical protein